jgi:hypothetical protein
MARFQHSKCVGRGAAAWHRVRTAVRQCVFLQSLVGTEVRVLNFSVTAIFLYCHYG